MPDLESLSLVNIEGGAAVEMFDRALAKVSANIADINTTLAARQIVLTVKVKPGRDRCACELDIGVKVGLAGQEPVKTTALIDAAADGQPQLFGRRKAQIDIPFEVKQGGQG